MLVDPIVTPFFCMNSFHISIGGWSSNLTVVYLCIYPIVIPNGWWMGCYRDGLWLGLRRSLTRNWPNHTKSLRDLGDSSGTRSRRSWSSRPWSLPLCKYAWNFTSWPTWRSKSSEDLPKLKPMLTTKNPPWSRKPPNWCKWCGTYIILFWTAWDVASCCKPRWFTVLMSFCCMQHTKRGFFRQWRTRGSAKSSLHFLYMITR